MNVELLYMTLAKIIERREEVRIRIEVKKVENVKENMRA